MSDKIAATGVLGELLGLFQNPPAKYRPMPQWSWNGDLSETHISQRLQQFAQQGIGGLFAHARTGFMTGYLSPRWFELWDFACREAARLGIEFHIYDEFCCPAGNAGGMVVAERPHLARQELTLTALTGIGPRPEGDYLSLFRLREGVRVQVNSSQGASAADPIFALTLRRVSGKGGFGGMPDNDLLRREATDAFIASTHEGYARKSGDCFGRNVRFMFSDEPQLSGSGTGLPMSCDLLREFLADHGYDLEKRLGELCFSQEGSPAVRYDYFFTVNRLFNQNFMRPMHDWCQAHNLLFTGHLMEHEWPSPLSNPDAMASMRWMHAPGNDLLGFQFESTTLAKNGIYLLNLKELSSLTNQLGREWTMVESCGGQGYQAAYELFKPLEDWLLCHGINVMDPHLSHESLAGSGKYDWPQTLSEHSPWWKYYHHHAGHIARANAVLSQGREHNRVLVLHPTTTAWMHYEHPALALGHKAGPDPMEAIRASQVGLLTALTAGQVDYDLGDEFILQEFGHAQAGKLTVGERTYEIVILPPAMENWTESTLQLMSSYLASGGRLLALATPSHVNGRPSTAPAELQRQYPGQWTTLAHLDQAVAQTRAAVAPWLSDKAGAALPAGLAWRRAEMPGERGDTLWFFSNPWSEPIEAQVLLAGSSAAQLDTSSGAASELPHQQVGENLTARLTLPPRGHALWYVSRQPIAGLAAKPKRPTASPIELGRPAVQRLDANLLMIDYCDLTVGNRTAKGLATIHADEQNWKWQGFDGSPWRAGYQFKRTIIDRPVAPGTGFAVEYRFVLAEALPASATQSLRLGIERPWLYRITLNGQELRDAQPWFDEHMRAFPVGGSVRTGENILRLEARPMHMLCEIMPIYLMGSFAVVPAARGFEIRPEIKLATGPWAPQGMPFYPGAVRYTFPFHLKTPAAGLEITLGSWAGTVAAVRHLSRELGVIMHPPYHLQVDQRFETGDHQLEIDIIGNMRNMMGPHLADGLAGAWTWARCPVAMPPGKEYRFVTTGLSTPPGVMALG